MSDIKDYSTFNELNETKEERKLRKAARKSKRAKRLKTKQDKAEAKGKSNKASRLSRRIDKKSSRIVKLGDKFNNSKISKRLKIKAIRDVKRVVKAAISNIKRNKLNDKHSTKLEDYKSDYKILDFLIKVVRHDMGSKDLEEYISKLKSKDVIELLEKALNKVDDESNISDQEISDATGGLVTHLPSNSDTPGIDDDIFAIIRKHFLEVKDSFKHKVTKTSAPLLNTSLVHNSLEVVKFIQYMMNKLEFDAGTEDGLYGDHTKSAVIKFQKKYNINQSGEIDDETWKKILSLIKIEFDPDSFNTYTITPEGGEGGEGGVVPGPLPTNDLMARLKKWLQL